MIRKRSKKNAKRIFRKHYLFFVAICLIASFIGAEFTSSLSTLTGYDSFRQDYIDPSKAVTGLVGLDTLNFNSLVLRQDRKDQNQGRDHTIMGMKHLSDLFSENKVLGRSRGVLAQVVNLLASGSISMTFLSGIQSMFISKNVLSIILLALSLAAVLLFWIFLQNTYIVVSRRLFLEGRIYSEIPIQRFLFLFRIKCWSKAVWSMLVYKMLYLLWCLTIVGAFVKRYSYAMVPYIIAESPDIKAMDAIKLSRGMMYGHKWELFKLDLTFIGWALLGVVTAGISNIIFTNPYMIATYCEYYSYVRGIAIKTKVPGAQYLNDKYLYEKAPDALIEVAYNDVITIMKQPMEEIEQLKGVRGFLANVFGVVVVPSRKELEYEKSHAEHIRIKTLALAVNKQAYPYRLFKMPEKMKRKRTETIMYLRHYSIWSLIILFFIFSLFGYVWEVVLHLLSYGEIVNRGVLHGPWLPIYGSGGVLILILLNKLRKYPVAEFFAIMTLCGTVEYFTSLILEQMYQGMKWWDYSGYFLNLHGRICAEGLLVFGITGVAFVYVLAPLIDNMIKKIRFRVLIPICITLIFIFIIDLVYSSNVPNTGNGVSVHTVDGKVLEEEY